MMDQMVLTDKNQSPTEEIINSYIGKSKTNWESIFKYIYSNYPEFTEQWRYYKDGKSWLMKVIWKSKTVFWLSVIEDGFRITFYFGDKAEELILESSLTDQLKEQFKNGKRFGKIRALTVLMNNKRNVEFVKELISIKLRIK